MTFNTLLARAPDCARCKVFWVMQYSLCNVDAENMNVSLNTGVGVISGLARWDEGRGLKDP